MNVLTHPLRAWWLALLALTIPPLIIWGDKPLALYMKTMPATFQDVFQRITLAGESHYTLVPAGLLGLGFALWASRTETPALKLARARVAQMAGFVFACVAVGGIATNIFKAMFGRARPRLLFREDTYGFNPFMVDSSWNSFPSGHTNTAIAATLALAMLFPKWRWPLLIVGAVIAFSRVAVTAHYMGDVMGGTLLAILTCWFVGVWYARKGWLFTQQPSGLALQSKRAA